MNEVIHDELVSALHISISTLNILEKNKVFYLEDLIKLSYEDLSKMKINQVSLIERELNKFGLKLAIEQWKLCPKCKSEPNLHEVRNYNMAWGDGDVYCKRCGSYVRMWDSG